MHRRTRVKICGITRQEDAQHAIAAGADALGLVFYAKSPRSISLAQAQSIVQQLPPFVSSVGLFVNAETAVVQDILKVLPLELLQFHGEETPEYCAQFQRPYIKAIRMAETVDLYAEAQRYADARALLLDAYVPGVQGGTGQRFDWQRIPKDLPKTVVLAGGLDAENVAAAIQATGVYAVDVSGGVEAGKGIKDPAKIDAFMQAVQSTYA